MNNKRFETWMSAADEELLEEAQMPLPARQIRWRRVCGALAACLCVVVGLLMWRILPLREQGAAEPALQALPQTEKAEREPAASETMQEPPQDAAGAEPAQEPAQEPVPQPQEAAETLTSADLAALGYEMVLPEGAEAADYRLVTLADQAAPVAQATFTRGGTVYTYRALKSAAPADISGLSAPWSEQLDWNVSTLQMQLRTAEEEAAESWVGWYAAETETQWCLLSEGDSRALLHTAQEIVETIGYDMAVAPADAELVLYDVFALDGLTVGETTFVKDGIGWTYRTAATSALELSDISGMADGSTQAEGEVLWCGARISYTEGGAGKIIWFDIVPGLLYSLSMDSGASEEALLAMAGELFVPAQGEVG